MTDTTKNEVHGPPHRHVRSFALRRGHVTAGQRRAYETVLPRIAVAYAPGILRLADVFGREAPVVLEIGFGMGETTAAIAAAHPTVDFLGVEVFVAGIGSLARRVDEAGLANVRVIQHDAVEVVRDMIAPDALAGIHVYFPDPWPKARHHKRRLIAQPFVGQLASRLRPGGYLHCATDWQDYADQMLTVLQAERQLRNLHAGFAPEARNPLCQRPTTKFHARGERLGHGTWDLVFVRREADAAA
ncbi:MAG TPA: tRNA (guanosine(46)-N7)-methyltransferase TrmB [Burkholderiaceae bacterium]|nr:tRNA (guanosine(46)-N7)-methyltransferase TrmB [Burkholderiaceae bacterium]